MTKPRNPVLERVNPRMLRSEALQRCNFAECRGACCIFGVWVDLREVDDIMRHANLIQPHLPEEDRNPGGWFAAVEDDDLKSPSGKVIHTAVNNRPDHYGGTACIFCLADGKCALQVAAIAGGLHPWRYKPYYCILHPLDLDSKKRITLDKTETLVKEAGSCIRPADKPVPLIQTFSQELRYLLGNTGYNELQALAKKRAPAAFTSTPSIDLKPVTQDDKKWVKEITIAHWGAPEIVAGGKTYTPASLPGLRALVNSKPVGLITWQVIDRCCEIITLNSLQPGIGVGTALLDAAEQLARDQGCVECRIITTNDNLQAQALYQSHGYQVMEIRQGAVNEARRKKPTIPLTGENGIPIRDEVVLLKSL